jgi:anti-sigma-K factor RskA
VQHCSPEQLALAALREPLPAEDATHLEQCATCSAEVASLQRGVDVLAVPALAAPGASVPPPPRVWDAIAAATGVTTAPRAEPAPVEEAAPVEGAEVVQLPVRRSRKRWLPLAAAVLVGAAVGGGAVALTRDDDGAVVAATALDPLAAEDASGRAEVRERGGVRSLEVALDAPALAEGYYEVWLLQPDAVRMVPVGVVSAGDTVLPLPEGLDLGAYPVVDVSVEPIDGDPTHSGVSVARGQLPT